MTPEEIAGAFEPWRARHRRTAWQPVTGAEASVPSLSWFGGGPIMQAGQTWPTCAHCRQPMRFMLQLDLSTLPAEHGFGLREGLVQLFYCSTDDGNCETWAPFSGAQEARFSGKAGTEVAAPEGVDPFPKRVISGWKAVADYPSPQEHDELGVTCDYDFQNELVTVACPSLEIRLESLDIDLEVAECIATAQGGDKLAGWPFWIQGAEYPSCPECSARMHLLFQLDSEDHLPYMFGDVGCGHLTQCPNHPKILAFGWACG